MKYITELYDSMPVLGQRIVAALLMILIGAITIKILIEIIRRGLQKSNADPVLYAFVINAIKVVLVVMLVTMCLSVFNVSLTSILAVMGAAGAAVALALKDSLANVAGGVMIIVTKPFNQGDFIDIGTVSGQVQKIDLFLTTIKTMDNKTVTIPNGIVNTSVLVNHSRENNRRVDMQFGISYAADIARAKAVLWDVIAKDKRIFVEPEAIVAVAAQSDSAIMIDVKVWCETDEYWNVKYAMMENVKLAFDEAGIEIPYNQVDVHVHNVVE